MRNRFVHLLKYLGQKGMSEYLGYMNIWINAIIFNPLPFNLIKVILLS